MAIKTSLPTSGNARSNDRSVASFVAPTICYRLLSESDRESPPQIGIALPTFCSSQPIDAGGLVTASEHRGRTEIVPTGCHSNPAKAIAEHKVEHVSQERHGVGLHGQSLDSRENL
jgi:hypothetical protein